MKKLIGIFIFVCSACWGGNGDLELLIGPEEIKQKISEAALQIDEEYRDKELVILMVMKGAMCVSADLIRQLHIPFTVEHMKASSYGQNGMNRGELKITGIEDIDLTAKHVLVVDDIFDSGSTMVSIVSYLQKKHPKSLKTLVLLLKDVPRKTDYVPDYCLFDVPNRFIIGYGIDYKEHYRGLPGIYAFINDTPPKR